jgi:hypothetical protein
MELALPPACRDVVPAVSSDLGDALLERRLIDCGADGLAGKQIRFPGLDQTLSDVLVRIVHLNGGTFTSLVKASRPSVVVEGSPSAWAVAWQYLELGVAHILLGFDHLLFVLALLLIVQVGSLTKGLVVNPDKSVDVYFGPKAPAGEENNWVQTMPGKGWNVIFRLYSPLKPWYDKTWRPGEIELVK